MRDQKFKVKKSNDSVMLCVTFFSGRIMYHQMSYAHAQFVINEWRKFQTSVQLSPQDLKYFRKKHSKHGGPFQIIFFKDARGPQSDYKEEINFAIDSRAIAAIAWVEIHKEKVNK